MQQALLVRLRPAGPWRYGPSDGALDRVDTLYRSDRLFSAVTIAMRQLGALDEWLAATARSEKPAVAFTSLFPFQNEILYVTPPANLWPPPPSLITSPSPVFLTKMRWRAAYFVPLSLVDSLLTGQAVLADQWIPDPDSGCLLRRDRPSSSPFRTVSRAFAPVDRLSLTAAEAEASGCVEFESGAGLWTLARFSSDTAYRAWNDRLRAAFRLLADTGFGGARSRGWGQVHSSEFETGTWPGLILPKVARSAKDDVHEEQTARSYWLLSLYSPASHDAVNWSAGQYELAVRNGRVDGSNGALKKSTRMVVEGCVLEASAEPVGTAVDVAPEGFAHPVYRSGIALSLLIPPPKPQSEDRRAIEEIVPPELEATPFPMPPAFSPAPVPGEPPHPAPSFSPAIKESETRVVPEPEAPATASDEPPHPQPSFSPAIKESETRVVPAPESPATAPDESPHSQPSFSPAIKESETRVVPAPEPPATVPDESPHSQPSFSPAIKESETCVVPDAPEPPASVPDQPSHPQPSRDQGGFAASTSTGEGASPDKPDPTTLLHTEPDAEAQASVAQNLEPEPPIHEPEPDHEPAPPEEPPQEPDPVPIHEPGPEPSPIEEPTHEPVIEVVPDDVAPAGEQAEPDGPRKDNGYEI